MGITLDLLTGKVSWSSGSGGGTPPVGGTFLFMDGTGFGFMDGGDADFMT